MFYSGLKKAALVALFAATTAGLGWGLASWPSGAVGEESPVALTHDSSAAPVKPLDRAASDAANSLSRAFRHAAEVAMPSVVTIRSKTKAQVVKRSPHPHAPNAPQGANPFKGTPFEDFFKNGEEFGLGELGQAQRPQREGMGSGVIIDKSGIVLTNNHVVAGADEVLVQLADGREFKGEDIKTDENSDLAIVHIKGAGSLPVASLGNSDNLEIGDWVIAIGNPFELEHTVSAGIISGKGRELGSIRRAQFLQTDAAINPGNSGGPLVNLDGEVIGINTAIASTNGSFAGIGFANPINNAKWVVDQLIKKGSVERAYLGVAIGEVTRDLAEKVGVKHGQGVLVSEVFPGSPAAEAGIQEGDVILKFGDRHVHGPRELQELVERVPLDSKQTIEVKRDGKAVKLTLTAKALPQNFGVASSDETKQEAAPEPATVESDKLGLEVADMTAAEASTPTFKSRNGVVIKKVEPNSPAAEQGLREGMLVMKVGGKWVKNVDEFKEAVKGESLKDGVMLLVRTQRGNHIVVLR